MYVGLSGSSFDCVDQHVCSLSVQCGFYYSFSGIQFDTGNVETSNS